MTPIDFCFGEPLIAREAAHEQAVGIESDSVIGIDTCTTHIISLSKTSKFILFLWSLVALITIVLDLVYNSSSNLLVLFLTFAQPIVILYFLYWRSRRQYAYLDYVVKCFAYGFWYGTSIYSLCISMCILLHSTYYYTRMLL